MSTTVTYTLAETNGPYVIGYSLSFGLMGALVVQAYIYYTRFTEDRRAIKILVTVVLLLETLITAFTFSGFWVSETQEPVSIAPSTMKFSPVILAPVSSLVTTLVHGFYCWRISTIRRFRLLPLLIMMFSLLQLGSITYLSFVDGLFPSIFTFSYAEDQQLPHIIIYFAMFVTWEASTIVCDLAITICMVLSFSPSESRFITSGSKSTLVKLTRLTIETGLVTTVATLVELILRYTARTWMSYIAVFYVTSKLYSNCLLVNLNHRLILRNQSDPNMTAIVWDSDNVESDMQSGQPGDQPPQATHTLDQTESHTDMTASVPRKNSSVEDQTYEMDEFPANDTPRHV